jgi:uncharacterized membrane protein
MLLFELIGLVLFIPIAAIVLHKNMADVGLVGVLISLSAMLWNFVYNWLFDIVEFKLGGNRFGRGVLLRCLHALLFEIGLLVATVPMVAHFLNMTVLNAFLADIGFVVFFLIYAFIFNWCFDQCYLSIKKK